MTMTLNDFKTFRNGMRKDPSMKDVVTLYGVIIGAIETEMKVDPSKSENEVIEKVLNNQYKKAKQTLEYDESEFAQLYFNILDGLLPKQMTEEELRVTCKAHNFANIGEWMKFLKEHYPNQYDGKVASNVFKSCSN